MGGLLGLEGSTGASSERPIALHDPVVIEAHLRRDPELRLYEIGDLDPFFWSRTCWYAEGPTDAPERLALVYIGEDPPVLLALGREVEPLSDFVERLAPLLPRRVYAHLSDGVIEKLSPGFGRDSVVAHFKMALRDPAAVRGLSAEGIERLSAENRVEIAALYERSYPGNWFAERMLETGKYFGLWEEKALVAIAGVHVYSARHRVAALGNITVGPELRGRGLGSRVTAALCRDLAATTDVIGLNVRADNAAAIACYRRLGFEVVARYDEAMLTLA